MPTKRVVSVRVAKFATVVREEGRGEPLLVLHDFDVQHEWEPYLDLLARDHRVIAPLHPGYGDSTGIDHVDDPLDMAIFYEDLLDQLDLEAVNVVGIDLGGMFACELAALAPRRVKNLVLVAPMGLAGYSVEVTDLFAMDIKAVPPLLFHDPEGPVAKAHAPGRLDPENVEESTVQQARAWSTACKFIWPFPEHGLERRIHRVTANTLLIWGEHDGFVPVKFAQSFRNAIPNAHLAVIPGAGHFPNLEQPEQFAAMVGDFLKHGARPPLPGSALR